MPSCDWLELLRPWHGKELQAKLWPIRLDRMQLLEILTKCACIPCSVTLKWHCTVEKTPWSRICVLYSQASNFYWIPMWKNECVYKWIATYRGTLICNPHRLGWYLMKSKWSSGNQPALPVSWEGHSPVLLGCKQQGCMQTSCGTN